MGTSSVRSERRLVVIGVVVISLTLLYWVGARVRTTGDPVRGWPAGGACEARLAC